MKWRGGRRSRNIEDRHGQRAGGKMLGGGIGTIALVLIAWYLGIDPTRLMESMQSGGQVSSSGTRPGAEDLKNDPLADMVSVVIANTEGVWTEILVEQGQRYEVPTFVIFTGATRSVCGTGQVAMGPFYCSANKKAYIALSFYDQMRTRFKATGDFAQAYAIAHEIDHHVQNLSGVSGKAHSMKLQLNTAESNALPVRLELQADCFAGVWANRARKILENGDVDEALNAASAIGDDTLQSQSRAIVPESFTHDNSAQRKKWFRIYPDHGDPDRCNTFA